MRRGRRGSVGRRGGEVTLGLLSPAKRDLYKKKKESKNRVKITWFYTVRVILLHVVLLPKAPKVSYNARLYKTRQDERDGCVRVCV